MALQTVKAKKISVKRSCKVFCISETAYYYSPKNSDDNEYIANKLIELTQAHHNWGFKLCFLHIRNVLGKRFNHKRVYRIYCDLCLNLRIKPKKELKEISQNH